jgi:integrase
LKRGKRNPVWAGRYWEPVLIEGRFAKVRRMVILGECAEMTKARAQRALADRLRPLNDGLHTPASAETFAELWGKYQSSVLCNYRDSTRGFYERTTLRWILPYFERWPIEDITPLACQQFLNKFAGYSKSVLKHIRASLARPFVSAVEWGMLARNPAAALKLPKGKPVQRASVLTPTELAQVINGLGEPWRSMVVIDCFTGIRECEVFALRWADFDRERKVLSVGRSVYRGDVGDTKTEAGERPIPYPDLVEDALRRLEHFKSQISNLQSEYLFPTVKGKFHNPQKITRKIFKPLAAKLGVPAFTWRSFRRSVATAMHLGGVPLKVQQDILGHTNPDMSLLYTQPGTEDKRKALEGFYSLMEAGALKGAHVM